MSDLSPKQMRNGVSAGATADSAIPSTSDVALVAARINEATAKALDRKTAPILEVPASEGVVDWETGMAAGEQPGEA